MAHVYSIPVDDLIQAKVGDGPIPPQGLVIETVDILIVGSGYGASVAAMKLAGLKRPDGTSISLSVLERGREYSVGEFPNTLGELPGHVRVRGTSDAHPTGNPDALFDFRLGEDLDVMVGNGLGGGSLINANVAARPETSVFDASWPAKYRNGGLDDAFDAVESILGASKGFVPPKKFEAFSTLAADLGATVGPANITVTHGPVGSDSANEVGIDQPNCTSCGNCVTGCNVGSKNTLMMNLIPLAAERGAKFLTGANVIALARRSFGDDSRWRVELQRTHSIKTPLEGERFYVDARFVILAAGSLGSSEILLRSSAPDGPLALSDELGRKFSTNGDGLGFSYGQKGSVEAIGSPDIHDGSGPGPTITGIVQAELETDGGEKQPFSLEDAAIPASIVKVYGEALTTAAQLNRISDNRLPSWFDEPLAYDPLAYNPKILPHGQVLLMMCDDGAHRTLSLAGAGSADPAQRSVFPSALVGSEVDAANAGLAKLDDLLFAQNLASGFDGGQYLANPLWRLMPKGADDVMGGSLPGGRNLSVHPLGGCRMGTSHGNGVVNEDGAVFDPNGGLHDGLYVMDGSLFPGALTTNPFLTISALAWECSDALLTGPLAQEGWTVPSTRPEKVPGARAGLFADLPVAASTPAELILREQMLGRLLADDWGETEKSTLDAMVPGGRRFLERDGMILRVETEALDFHTRFASIGNGAPVIEIDTTLYRNPESAELSTRRRRYGAPKSLSDDHIVASGKSKMTILALDHPSGSTFSRATKAVWAYFWRRGISVSVGGGGGLAGMFDKVGKFWKTGEMHARYREFQYEVSLAGDDGTKIELTGSKWIRWVNDEPRVWDTLLRLPIDEAIFTNGTATLTAPARLAIDAAYMLDEGLIQIDDSDDMVESVVGAVAFLGWFARCLLESSFWEFGAHAYPKTAPTPDLDPPKLKVGWFKKVAPESVPLPVPGPEDENGEATVLPLELVRYPQGDTADPVLLIHGLAQGSGVYTTPKISRNMARYFWKEGYEVWLLDYRLSNRFDAEQVPYGKWGIDAIGEHDIPKAIEKVYAKTGKRVKIFAHCVGAIAVQMATLKGRLETDEGESMVESVCFNAIHPWIVPAPANLARSKLGAFASTWISDDLLDPILQTQDEVTGAQTLVDRVGFSLARIEEDTPEGGDGHGNGTEFHQGVCDRMSFLYGRMWRHENLESSLKKGWLDIVGRAPKQVYLQLYYLIERERILNDVGRNEYLTEANLKAHWGDVPTFFIHGEESDVFNPQSATRSAFRLNKILRDEEKEQQSEKLAPVYLRRIAGYGHMDPILAKDAHEDVFPDIAKFFQIAALWHENGMKTAAFDEIREQDDPGWSAVVQPETGHAVRAAWIDDGKIAIRYWFERYAYNTSPAEAVGIRIGSETKRTYENAELITLSAQDFSYVWLDDRPNPVDFEPPEIVDVVKGLSVLHVIAPPAFFRREAIEEVLLRLLEVVMAVIRLPEIHRRVPIVLDSGHGSGPESREPRLPGGVIVGRVPNLEVLDDEPAPEDDFEVEVTAAQPPWYRRLVEKLLGQDGASDRFRFLLGSCRYPGTPVESALSDRIFEGMLAHSAVTDFDMAFFVGDQIYADAYNDLFDNADWRDHYIRSYRTAFNSSRMAHLLASMPIHFAMDDHEIVDNWSGGAEAQVAPNLRESLGPQALIYGGIKKAQVDHATRTARTYMSSARAVVEVGDASKPPPDSLWYALDHVGEVNFPCFVLDTRSERALREIESHTQLSSYPPMLSPAQLAAFTDWLSKAATDRPDRPKFVFAGQILAPAVDDLRDHPGTFRREEGFLGYPGTLRKVIEHIVDNDIRNVVFVGGDLHMSCAAELTLRAGEKTAMAWQIVASGLYSPMPFANARPTQYSWSTPQAPTVMPDDGTVGLSYTAEWLTDRRSHFLDVEVARAAEGNPFGWQIFVRAHGPDGAHIAPQKAFESIGGDLRVAFV